MKIEVKTTAMKWQVVLIIGIFYAVLPDLYFLCSCCIFLCSPDIHFHPRPSIKVYRLMHVFEYSISSLYFEK